MRLDHSTQERRPDHEGTGRLKEELLESIHSSRCFRSTSLFGDGSRRMERCVGIA